MIVAFDLPQANAGVSTWCIYVGKPARTNFEIGRDASTWGVDRLQKLDGLKKGDRVIFVERLSKFNRLSRDEFPKVIEEAATILEVLVTSDVYEDQTPLWPDGSYPYRFKFEEVAELRDTRLVDVMPPDVVEAIRMSSLKQGSAVAASSESTLGISSVIFEELVASTYMNRTDLQDIQTLLLEKQQLILEGPPGSGKTFLAKRFARYFTGNLLTGPTNGAVEIVQFHQSYGYEDFVQGIRPSTRPDGSLQYEVKPGIFMRFCAKAAEHPTKRFVLIIDEINRGNVSRIFGELLFLLEYRDEKVLLPYGDDSEDMEAAYFSIPPNVFIIGTMNSTDRSLALIDYALRRRFYFYRVLPVVDGKAPVLANWLATQEMADNDRDRLLQLFLELNDKIRDFLPEDFQVGHSYFMSESISDSEKLERVWRHAVTPLLTEYFHSARDSDDILKSFTIAALSDKGNDDAFLED